MGSSSRNLYAGIGEGQSTSRPPLFDGTNYSYWKERMRIYIRSTNFQLWLVIKNGEEIPMKKVGETTVPKTENEFDAEDIKKIENYAKAINMLYCAVNPDDYRKISCCTTAKEMWDKLEATYEGTDQVREAKIDFLTQEYEMFRIKEGDKIDDMFDRFSKIINDLHALKKTYTNKDLVRKILRSLTPEWRSKADAIYESIRVSNVTIDGLRGNLKTYESTILTPSLDEQKKKGIALKATKEPVEEASSDDDNEFGLVIKKFHKFMKKEFERKGRKHDGPPKCYGCGEIGQIKPRCPKAKHGKDKPGFKKQRAYISWGGDSGDESTDQEEDEAANLCLMAHEDQSDDVQEDKSRAATSGKSKSKSRAPTSSSEERLYYGDGSYLWFDFEEERTRFLTFFSKRVVAPPRIIPERYPELQGYDELDAQLHQAGLWPFVSRAHKEINPALIRAFYSNPRREDDVLYSLVKSTPIELTVEQLGRIAGLPFQGDDVSHYGGEDWVLNNEGLILNELGITELIRHASGRPTIHSANPDGRLLLYIVSRIIKPKKHGHTIMSGEDLKLIHAIMHSAPINWAKFVMINMTIAASTDHDHLLPYPFVVMDILERFKVTTTVGPLTKATKIWAVSKTIYHNYGKSISHSHIMERTSRTLPYTIRFIGLLGSHSLGRNPKFVATAVDLGREVIRRKIKLAYGGGSVGLQGAVASTVFTNGGLVRGFIPGYIATRWVYGPTYGVEHTVSSNYYKYFEMNHAVEAFIVLPRGVDTMEGLFTLISWASEGLHNRPIGLLNIDSYFNNLLKFLDDAVRQNFMASSQRKLFISSFFVDELLEKLEFAKAFPRPGFSYNEFVNPGRLDLELHL
ncbi:unnamed protein product [Cuscuta campestris]|uniref:cytokinin riboside 5'-monophosphate phosphoribohydrolase n=1 Tax=Cuscuta campestris TaxID=132261 RepID=A0A484KNG9_9ASTE|nr:unnamed protein product [Cuscuta campestris]